MKSDECDGCLSNYKDMDNMCSDMTTTKTMVLKDVRHISECPCSECLVKTMCSVPCQEFLKNKRRVIKSGI